MFPAISVALTWKVWLPSANAVKFRGLVQAEKLPLSSLHSKVEPVSVAVKLKPGAVLLDGLAGLAEIPVSGGVKSTVQV